MGFGNWLQRKLENAGDRRMQEKGAALGALSSWIEQRAANCSGPGDFDSAADDLHNFVCQHRVSLDDTLLAIANVQGTSARLVTKYAVSQWESGDWPPHWGPRTNSAAAFRVIA